MIAAAKEHSRDMTAAELQRAEELFKSFNSAETILAVETLGIAEQALAEAETTYDSADLDHRDRANVVLEQRGGDYEKALEQYEKRPEEQEALNIMRDVRAQLQRSAKRGWWWQSGR